MAEFKKISDTEVVEAPSENDTLVIVSNGEVKQVSAATFAAASSGGGVEPISLITSATGEYLSTSNTTLYDGSEITKNVFDAFITGTPVYLNYNTDNTARVALCTGACEYSNYDYGLLFYIYNGSHWNNEQITISK